MYSDMLGFVLSKLDLRSPAWTEVARGTGVPYDTLKKIATRRTLNPGVQHVQRIADFFVARGQPAATPANATGLPPGLIQPGLRLPPDVSRDRRGPAHANPYPDLDRRAAAATGD